MNSQRREKTAFNIYALFVYAGLIVDLYRKFSSTVFKLPLPVTTFRNLVYVLFFIAIFLMGKNVMHLLRLCLVSIVFAVLTALSWLINIERGAGSLYIDVMFMFISRLLPAYYIGTKIVGKEKQFVSSINKFQLLTVLYVIFVLLYPEVSETSYLTISGNLLIPVLVALLAADKGIRHILIRAIGLVAMLIILIYGGRTSLVAVALAIGIIFLVKLLADRSSKKAAVLIIGASVALLLIFAFGDIVEYLYKQNPDSRTLKLMMDGEFFWTSNRNHYYEAAFASFWNHPFRIYGFLGDRFYYYDTFRSMGGNDIAVTMFSHNTLLELMLNFGILIGAAIIVYFIFKMRTAVKILNSRRDETAWKVHIIIFASAFAPLFISSSWLNDYTIWLMAGVILGMGSKKATQFLAENI